MSMKRNLERQLLDYIKMIDSVVKELSVLRKSVTRLLYRLPKEEISPIKLPKEKITPIRTGQISESLSDSPSRHERRNKRLELDDFMDALEKSGFNVGQQMHQMSYMIGAETGCKVKVNDDVIRVYQYNTPLEWSRSQDRVANGNLMMYKQEAHKDWDSILRVFKSL